MSGLRCLADVTFFFGVLVMGLAPGGEGWARGATFVVAPDGKDSDAGTAQRPLGTLRAACEVARKTAGGPHHVVVMPGDYFLAEPVTLDARDNGLTIEAGPGGPVTLYGGQLVGGWRRDGQHFWTADLPGVKEGTWDFRALVVNGRLASRARLPQSGTFVHRGTWNLPLLPAVSGYWERQPTVEELTTMPYDPQDIPAGLDVKNAEVRLYHMWDESLVGVARNDTQRHALIFAQKALFPVGAFGIKKYVVYNTREGMTQPGLWYLDRTAGRVVYWPLPDEDMARAKIIAPRLERIIRVAGDRKKNAENITLCGLTLSATTPPLKPAGFGAGQFDGALSVALARQSDFERLEIANAGGLGIQALAGDCRFCDCHVHHTGACGLKIEGLRNEISRNHVHHVGQCYPSAAAAMIGGQGHHVYRNEIHDGPYSGLIGQGKQHRIEENLIYRVMLQMQDGAAIYGNLTQCTLRANLVRDVVQMGEGYGVSAYYLDEGARDCVVEHNVSVGVARPVHNHIARGITIRDNTFIAGGDMTLSFQSSAGCSFEHNTLLAPGKITVLQPNAVTSWTGNVLFRGGQGPKDQPQAFTIDDAMPQGATPGRKPYPAEAVRVERPPALDGQISPAAWPGRRQTLDRDRSRQPACGPPVVARFCYDDQFLYVAASVSMFEPAKLSLGAAWGKDDGLEISLAGATPEGRPATFVIRGYSGGAVQSAGDAGAASEAAACLGREVRFAAKIVRGRSGSVKDWRGQWAIPWAALGLKPAAGKQIPFNMAVFCSEFGEWHCWEGTTAESWRLDQGGTLLLK